MKIDVILVPTDFSPDAEQAVSTSVELAKRFGARIVVVHAYHLDIPMASPMAGAYTLPQGLYEKIGAAATARVEKVATEMASHGVPATGIALAGPASLAILEQAETHAADLIVMGTRGLTGIKHVLLGSVAERVVRTAPCPVLTVKADRAVGED